VLSLGRHTTGSTVLVLVVASTSVVWCDIDQSLTVTGFLPTLPLRSVFLITSEPEPNWILITYMHYLAESWRYSTVPVVIVLHWWYSTGTSSTALVLVPPYQYVREHCHRPPPPSSHQSAAVQRSTIVLVPVLRSTSTTSTP
jgi:hypothetical protein